jgi:manganese/zinc/iron transport system permease protein
MAIILVSRYAGDVHLDTDAVLIGELAFTPFERLILFGWDIGPRGFYLMGGILLLNLFFILLLYKERLHFISLAAALGFLPTLLHYGVMGLVSVTVVGAFDIVGSILVVALIVTPPATAYLLTDSLPRMIGLSALLGGLNAVAGYWLAHFLDVSIAGSIATMGGIIFLIVYMLAPERGLIAQARKRLRQRWEFALTMLVIHLFNHEGLPEEESESDLEHLSKHIRWQADFANQVVRQAQRRNLVQVQASHLKLTDQGRLLAQQAVVGF